MTQPKAASKFTPGPWRWAFLPEDHGYETLVGSNGFRILIHSSEDGEVKERDKSVIAKAPEMYELLEYVLNEGIVPRNLAAIRSDARRIKAEIDGEG